MNLKNQILRFLEEIETKKVGAKATGENKIQCRITETIKF